MTIPFGKFKGRRVDELPTEYLVWLLTIELRDPELQFAVLSEAWERRRAGTDAPPRGDEFAIRLKRCDLSLARRVWDAGQRALAKKLHPDLRGGDGGEMARLNALVANVRSQLAASEAQ